MDTREWIFVLGVIAVVIIALILAARWRRQRFDDIQSGDLGVDSDGDFMSDELPGGGARTVGYRDPSDIERMNDEIRERAEASKPRLSSFRPEPVIQPSLLDEDDPDEDFDEDNYPDQEDAVPLLLDPSDEHNPEPQTEHEEEHEDEHDGEHEQYREQEEQQSTDNSQQSQAVDAEELQELKDLAEDLKDSEPELDLAQPKVSETELPETGLSGTELRAEPDDQPSRLKQETNRQEPKKESKPAAKENTEPGEIIIINLMTEPAKPYEGADLLKLANELGLRHGDMDIFHYRGRHGDEEPQFRMANLLKPGYFDINNMQQTRTHALCFFFELMPDQDNMKVYESMLSVINKLRDDLGGELHDENRSVFTIQTSEHCRNRIRDYQRRHLLAR